MENFNSHRVDGRNVDLDLSQRSLESGVGDFEIETPEKDLTGSIYEQGIYSLESALDRCIFGW